jgi:MFS family permease
VILRERSLVALLVAEAVSTTGAQMTWLALPWFVLTTTGSAGRMVLVVAAEAIGLALFGLPGGSVLARLGPRRMMMLSDGVRGPLTLLIPILQATSRRSARSSPRCSGKTSASSARRTRISRAPSE